jgi:hypothetical protein
MSPIILQRENEANLASYLAIGSKACKPPTLALKMIFDSSIKINNQMVEKFHTIK